MIFSRKQFLLSVDFYWPDNVSRIKTTSASTDGLVCPWSFQDKAKGNGPGWLQQWCPRYGPYYHSFTLAIQVLAGRIINLTAGYETLLMLLNKSSLLQDAWRKRRFLQAVEVHKQADFGFTGANWMAENKLQSLSMLSECSLQYQDQQSWSQGALFAELAESYWQGAHVSSVNKVSR